MVSFYLVILTENRNVEQPVFDKILSRVSSTPGYFHESCYRHFTPDRNGSNLIYPREIAFHGPAWRDLVCGLGNTHARKKAREERIDNVDSNFLVKFFDMYVIDDEYVCRIK